MADPAIDMLQYGKALADFWTLGSKAFLSAQEMAGKALAEQAAKAASASNLSAETDGVTRASQAFTELWSAANALATSMVAKLPQGVTSGSSLDPTVEAAFRKMLDPSSWLSGTSEMDEVVSRMAEGPRFADMLDIERRNAKVFHAWLTMRRCSLEHAAVTMEAWLRAGRRFSEQAAAGKDQTDGRALLDLWTGIANEELIQTQRSEPFLRTQAAMIRASTALKTAQRDLAEFYGEQLGIPSRTELDDVHKSVTELRRELRALARRQGAPVAAQAAEPPAAPKPPRPRKART